MIPRGVSVTKRFQTNAPADDYEVFIGPSYLDGMPDQQEWRAFCKYFQDPSSLAFAALWQEKAMAANGVPLRSDFSFKDLVKYGTHLALYKLTEENRWLTTFCGDGVVQHIGFEPTGKCLDEYADKDTLEFWAANIKRITEHCEPVMEIITLDYVNKDYSRSKTLNLPLRSGLRDLPDMFICHVAYEKKGQ